MERLRLAGLAIAGIAAALTVAAAQRPSVLAQIPGGLWEVSGVSGAKAPVRQCFGDGAVLARFEHRSQNCSVKVTSDSSSSLVVDYSCGASGFGHSRVDFITPRSLRIDTQGVSDKLPFSYVLQARRVGDCPTMAATPRH